MQNSSRNMIYVSGTDNLNSFAESYIMAIIYVVLTGRQWSDPLFVYRGVWYKFSAEVVSQLGSLFVGPCCT